MVLCDIALIPILLMLKHVSFYNIVENISYCVFLEYCRSNNQWVWKGYFVNIARVAIPYYYYIIAPNQLYLSIEKEPVD
jgi:hypothetical protein